VIALGQAVLRGVVRRVHARQAAESLDAQAGVVGQRGQAALARRVARLGERILDEGAVRLGRLGNAELGLAHEFHAQRREQRLQLGQLARVVGREDQLHAGSAAFSAAFCAVTSSPMLFSARPISTSISRRVKAAPSAVPCTSTKWPAPVMTTFMSVSQAASSTYSRSSKGTPSRMPTDTAATWSRIGDSASLPLAI